MKAYHYINKTARHVPHSHLGDARSIDFFFKAVVGHEWAEEPIIPIATYGLSFQQFYAELEAELQPKKKAKFLAAERASRVQK